MSKENKPFTPGKKMYLTSHLKARKHLTHLINEFNQAETPDVQRYRCLTFMFNSLLSYFQLESNLEIEKRLDEIERKLEGWANESKN